LPTKLTELVESDYRGPRASFAEVHVLKAILELGRSGTIGRGKLGSILNIGQGEVRTLIKRLKDNGLIRIEASGCTLTEKGKREFGGISKTLPWLSQVNARALGIGKSSYAVVIRGKADRVKKGIEQRDAAIKAGASGALTVIYSGGKFKIPDEGTDCEVKGPSEPWTSLRREAEPKNGDVLIISAGDKPSSAEYGALAAALTLI
jgi:DNA-binding MarR family transcriptional regulator